MRGLSLMLLTIPPAVAGLAGLLAAWRLRRPRWAWWILGCGALWGASYAALLLGASLGSREKLLGIGERKALCGAYLDCHIHVAVDRVRTAQVLGGGPRAARARGRFCVVTLRVSSDAVRATLRPASLEAVVFDERGRRHRRSPAAERALPGAPARLDQAVGPGRSYTRTVVFDLPAEARHPRLYVGESAWQARLTELFLIGDEESFLHRKTLFRLDGARG